MSAPADRFDEIRRKWIARHQHTFIFQKRRAEILARQIRDRAQILSGARVDPADDDIIHPLLMRPVTTPYAGCGCRHCSRRRGAGADRLACRSGGLQGCRSANSRYLRTFPVAAFMWASAVTGLPLVLLYDPDTTLAQTVLLPWLAGSAAGHRLGRGHLRHPRRLAGGGRVARLVADAASSRGRQRRLWFRGR